MSIELSQQAARGDFTAEVLEWIAGAMRRHQAGEDLDVALGLDRVSRIRERDRALRDAAALLAGADRSVGPWRCARLLEGAIRRFETRIRPLMLRQPGMTLSPLDDAIRRAFDTGQSVPTTTRNLYEIVK